jgi:Flp pilus assembly pilin Flp
MRNLLVKLWRDESGVVSPEWAFIVTILVLGAVTGIVASRQATVRTYDEPAIVQTK